MALLSSEEAHRVAEHVAAAERRTAGEVMVVLARRSAEYGRERAAASFALTLLIALGVYRFLPSVPEIWVLCGQAPVVLLLWWLSGLPPVTRWLVPSAIQRQAVSARAKQAFVELGVTETSQRSGVLLYLSEGEHVVELLADRGIHERVGAEGWQRLVDGVVTTIREGHAVDGILAAVDSIGETLSQHFPRGDGDVNELPNAVTRM